MAIQFSGDIASLLYTRLTERQRDVDPAHADQATRRAGVLVPLFLHQAEYHLLYTLRPTSIGTHSGEVAFPGGRYQQEDASLMHTALREAEEEVGLKPEDVTILGPLDDLRTRSTNYLVTPYVGLVPPAYPYRPDPKEVAEIFSVPLAFLQDPHNHSDEIWEHEGERIPIVTHHYQGYTIWGATQRMTQNLLEVLNEE